MTTDSCSGEINCCCLCSALCCVSSHPAHITCHDALWVPTGLPHRQPVFGSLLRSLKCKHTEYTHTHTCTVQKWRKEVLRTSCTHVHTHVQFQETGIAQTHFDTLYKPFLWLFSEFHSCRWWFFFFSFVYYEQMSEMNRWSHLVSQSVQVDTDYIYHFDQRKMKIFFLINVLYSSHSIWGLSSLVLLSSLKQSFNINNHPS